METWNAVVIGLCALLLAFVAWKEWQRAATFRRLLRFAASLLAVASFAFLALPLTRNIKVANDGKQAVLLTEGCNGDSVRHFLERAGNMPVYIIHNQLRSLAQTFHAQFVSAAEWPRLNQTFSKVHVFGYGLDPDELSTFLPSALVFHPAPVPDGIASVHWQPKLKSGDPLEVQGVYFNSSAAPVKLILTGFDKNLDTASIPADEHGDFKMFAMPKQLGKAVYSLAALSGKDTIATAPVPFEITPPERLKVLALSASPDFETKFLKAWLFQNGYAVVSRTAISKNKFETEYLNTPQVPFAAITGAFLNDFNILVADASALAALTKRELAAIESRVGEKGLGLIIKSDSVAKQGFYTAHFPVVQTSGRSQKPVHIYVPGINKTVALPTERPAYIRHQPGTQMLVQDNGSNIVVSSRLYGAGKIVYTTLGTTYAWMLSGAKNEYQRFWSYLFSKATAQPTAALAWSVSPEIPFVDKPVQLMYASNSPGIPRVKIGGALVSFIQDPDLAFQWQGTYWPKNAGWQPVVAEDGSTFWWYAYQKTDWKTVAALQKINATARYGSSGSGSGGASQKSRFEKVPVNKIHFFLLFMICIGFLWFEEKLRN